MQQVLRKFLKILSIVLLTVVFGVYLFVFRPWADAQGWRFYAGLNPFAERVEVFSNWQTVSEQVYLKASATPRTYNRDLTALSEITYEFDGEIFSAADYFEKANLTGLMVLVDGEVVVENYSQGIDDKTTYHLWSASKSFTSTVVGIAVQEGKIENLNDRVDKYAPQFLGTAYGETPIKHVLMMSSGINFFHHKGKPDRTDLYFDIMILRQSLDEWAAVLPRRAESGTDFNYIATDTHVLSRVIEGAYNQPFIEVVQEKLWSPGRFSSDAEWGLDATGVPMGHCCLSITLQDFAHLGQIYLEDLVFGGEMAVAKNWLEMVQHAQGPFQEPRILEDGQWTDGYSLQWWLPVGYDQEFIARGASGQYLYVNKKNNYVVAQFSARGEVSRKEEITFYRAVGNHFE